MKTNADSLAVIERDGIASDGAFRIEFNAKMAKILSDGLYSDKIGSIIRELSCNAIDSHVEAGTTRPVEVHLPNQFDSFFYVQDFGVGLDDKQVMKIYTVYGASTKIDSNDYIGQLGLGSKSPFSYVDAFDVTIRKNGHEWQYSMYKDESGMPSAALLGEYPTIEPNGVMVKLPVKKGDASRFAERATEIFKWFDIKPKVLGVSDFNVPDIKIEHKGSGWRIQKSKAASRYYDKNPKPVARMGRVAYPINPANLPGMKPAHIAACELPFILDFNIGDLEVAASREALSYDPRTQKNVLDRIDLMLTELGDKFSKEISSAKTEWDARKAFGKFFDGKDDGGFNREFRNIYSKHGFKWHNKLITDSIILLDISTIWVDTKTTTMATPGHLPVTSTVSVKPPIYDINNYKKRAQLIYNYDHTYKFLCDDVTHIVFDDLERGGMARACYYRDTLYETPPLPGRYHDQTVKLIGPSKLKTIKQIAKMLGDPPYKLTSELPKKPSEQSVRIKVLEFKRFARTKTSSWESTTVDLDKGGVYVLLDGYTPMRTINGVKHEMHRFNDIVDKVRKLKILGDAQAIYAPRSELRKQFVDNDKWVEFTDKVAAEVGKLLTPVMLQEIADNKEYSKCMAEYRQSAIWSYPAKLATLDKNGTFYKLAMGMMGLSNSAKKSTSDQYNYLSDIAKWLGTEIKVVPPSFVSGPLFAEFDRRYPLIREACSRYTNSAIDLKNIDVFLDYVRMCDERDSKQKP